MRFPTVLVASVFVLAGMSTAIPVERENMLVARFAGSDFLADVKARAYGEEPELYARGGIMSKLSQGRNKDSRPPSYKNAIKESSAYQRIPPSPTLNRNNPPPSYGSAQKDLVITRRPQKQGFRAELFGTLNDMAL